MAILAYNRHCKEANSTVRMEIRLPRDRALRSSGKQNFGIRPIRLINELSSHVSQIWCLISLESTTYVYLYLHCHGPPLS